MVVLVPEGKSKGHAGVKKDFLGSFCFVLLFIFVCMFGCLSAVFFFFRELFPLLLKIQP